MKCAHVVYIIIIGKQLFAVYASGVGSMTLDLKVLINYSPRPVTR